MTQEGKKGPGDGSEVARASTTNGLPMDAALAPTLEQARAPRQATVVNLRVVFISLVSVAVAAAAGLVAQALTRLIGLITNLSFYGHFSFEFTSPAYNHLGLWVMVIPVIGGLIVGLMARYGSAAIRGHGIPEAMEQILFGESRIPPRITFLKPISAAIAIGMGGPFGAEGPIIATGGALGSLVGQLLKITADERKTLLAAGAAAGMAATFGSPISAVLLAIELLLFEYRPRSVIPVALACATAAGIRVAFVGSAPIFPMPNVPAASGEALAMYIVLGAVVGVASVYVTRAVYGVEDVFDHLPVHWMWWPAIGAIAVGVVGYFAPHTLGVGYDNIEHIISGTVAGRAVLFLFVLKFISWAISLGSGTSGGTLAPLFTIGGGLGSVLGALVIAAAPGIGMDVRMAALVGMAAMFAGASRALLASVVFAFETTRQPVGVLPLLGGCTAAYLISALMMRNTIMTEKIARRGARVVVDYTVDYLDQVLVKDCASRQVVALRADDTVESVRAWLESHVSGTGHQGWPVLDKQGDLVGVLTRKNIFSPSTPADVPLRKIIQRSPAIVYEDNSVREAADHMVSEDVGRLPVVTREAPSKVVGWMTRSDMLSAHKRRLDAARNAEQAIEVRLIRLEKARAG
ncbi:MAG TPA: chloride channel protein [Terriglobales bacterium]|nr:chloride channel protein [Terriglobales bacterium]